MSKKGMSGDMVLQIGLLGIAAFTTLMAVNLFYDSVEVSVFGNPYLAAKTMSSYTDFIDSSPMPMKIYHEIPQDFMGNPGYGTVLYNPETCEFRVNKYPQDYMSDVILNHAWDTVTLEEALSVYALNKYSKKLRTQLLRAGAYVSPDNTYINDRMRNKLLQDQIKDEGVDLADAKRRYFERTGKVLNPDDTKALRNALAYQAADGAMDLSKFDGSFDSFWKAVDQGIADDAAKKAPGVFSKSKKAVVNSAVITANLVTAPIRFVTAPFRKATTTVKSSVSKAMTEAGNQFKKRIVKPILRGLGLSKFLAATQDIAPPWSTAIATGLSLASYGLEYWWTYIPIKHFIDRSQDATEAINSEWATVSCLSKPEKVIITKPNCESEPFAVYPDLTSWLDGDNTFGEILNPLSVLESAFAMPKSRPINEVKEYSSSESEGEVCVDYHNYLLSTDADIIGDKYINPRTVMLDIPFLACGGISVARPSWGPACTGTYALTYVSMWATPQDGVESVKLAGAVAGASALVAGTSPAALAIPNIPTALGIDSTNFFPYISKSAGMVDTDNYYYIENPYMISIAKEYQDGEYVTEINKEL